MKNDEKSKKVPTLENTLKLTPRKTLKITSKTPRKYQKTSQKHEDSYTE